MGDNIAGGYLHNFGGHANPQRTVQACAWAMQHRGGRVLQHTTVQGFFPTGGKVTAVSTNRATIGRDTLVIAPTASTTAEDSWSVSGWPLASGVGVDGSGRGWIRELRGSAALDPTI